MSEEINTPDSTYENYEPHLGREIAEQALASVETELSGLVDVDALEAMKVSGAELIDTFKINAELFDSKIHSFLFAAIAKRKSETSPGDKAGQEFIADATMLLALEHSDRYGDVKDAIESDMGDGPELTATYEKFTNQEMTKDVERLVKNGMLNNVRKHLGVTEENEEPYEIKVLDIGDEGSLFGLQPSPPQDASDTDAQKTYENDLEAYESYKAAMLANLDAFATGAGMDGRIPPAWNIQVGGKIVLCLPSPTAKMLLDRDAIKNRFYSRNEDAGEYSDEARLSALVEHEYAHTQGGVALDRNVFYGITVEEVRVENASNNKHGYLDAKTFMRQIAVLAGFNATEYFDKNGKAGGEHFFMDMASVVGVDTMLEIAMVPPGAYIEDSRKIHQSANEYLGGYNGVLERLYEKNKDDVATQERMEAFKKRMRKDFPLHVRQSWLAIQAGGNRMPFVAELYEDIAAE